MAPNRQAESQRIRSSKGEIRFQEESRREINRVRHDRAEYVTTATPPCANSQKSAGQKAL